MTFWLACRYCSRCFLQKVLEGLCAADMCTNCIQATTSLLLPNFVVDLREQLCALWRELDGADPRAHAHKLATYHAWMALPLKPSTVRGPPHLLPRYLQLELSTYVLRNIARFRYNAHTLRLETGCW